MVETSTACGYQEDEAANGELTATIARLYSELTKVTGLVISVRMISQTLPTTMQQSCDALCPELVFPALANELLSHANESIALLEEVESLIRKQH